MKQGKVKFFDTQKGFGFIKPDEGGKDVFVHRNNVEALGPNQGLEEDEAIELAVESLKEGEDDLDNAGSVQGAGWMKTVWGFGDAERRIGFSRRATEGRWG